MREVRLDAEWLRQPHPSGNGAAKVDWRAVAVGAALVVLLSVGLAASAAYLVSQVSEASYGATEQTLGEAFAKILAGFVGVGLGAALAAAASRYDRPFAAGLLAASIGYVLVVPVVVATSDEPAEATGLVLLLAAYALSAGAVGAALGSFARQRVGRSK